jgi:hypothetical protein
MSKANHTPIQLDEDDMLPEYDFSKGVRGKHHQAYLQGHSVTINHQDGTTTTQEFPPLRKIAFVEVKVTNVESEDLVNVDRSLEIDVDELEEDN